jgi:hypothetical protein
MRTIENQSKYFCALCAFCGKRIENLWPHKAQNAQSLKSYQDFFMTFVLFVAKRIENLWPHKAQNAQN